MVRREWSALRVAGLPSEQRSSADESHRPHLTLFAGDRVTAGMEAALSSVVAGLHLPVRLGALTLFGPHRERYVLVHQVVPSMELLRLQRVVAEICEATGSGYFAAGRWAPHVTVARRVPGRDLPAVLEVLADVSAVDELATVTQCRRWDSDTRRTWLL